MALAGGDSILRRLRPGSLFPEYTWPQKLSGSIATDIPTPPQPIHRFISRFCGWVHKRLVKFSLHYYCPWVGVLFDNQIVPLPFGLLLKRSDGTRLEEVQAMRVARIAGFPVPKVICYGEHPDSPRAPVSILMTRLPGDILSDAYDLMTEEERKQVLSEVKFYLDRMRAWSNPSGRDRICSISNGPIRSIRVPQHLIGPCDNLQGFNESLIGPAWAAKHRQDYENLMDSARKLHRKACRIVFTHGDFMHHNILVKDGHVTGIIDWEAAGWYPDYWEFTTAWRYQTPDFWWWHFVHGLGGNEYLEESEGDRAVRNLTNTSFA